MRMFIVLLFASVFLQCNKDTKVMNTYNLADASKLKVELKIFSGRENPVWYLSGREIAAFLHLADSLPQTESKQKPDALGYNGFEVIFYGADNKQIRKITVYKGIVFDLSEKNEKYFSDKDKKLEKLLLQTASLHISPDLAEIVRNEIESDNK